MAGGRWSVEAVSVLRRKGRPVSSEGECECERERERECMLAGLGLLGEEGGCRAGQDWTGLD